MTRYAHVESPVGDLLLVGGQNGRLSALWMENQRWTTGIQPGWIHDDAPFAAAREQLGAYFAGERTTFDLPLDLDAGSAFQQLVWRALLEIPYGETRSYGRLAASIGRPGAARAVGLANGRNPIGIVVPCHRVVGADGSLTGYGGGLPRKRWLLGHETSVSIRTSQSELGSRPDGRSTAARACSPDAAPPLRRL
jgi:methylated-DNA-[protein]-cysteine S-methyltransferase